MIKFSWYYHSLINESSVSLSLDSATFYPLLHYFLTIFELLLYCIMIVYPVPLFLSISAILRVFSVLIVDGSHAFRLKNIAASLTIPCK